MNPFTFRPTTPGEHLLHLLNEKILGVNGLSMPAGFSWSHAVWGRGQALQDYAISLSSLNLTARLIKKAERVLEIDDAALHHGAFVTFLQQTLGLTASFDDVTDEIARESLYAANKCKRPISAATKRRVRENKLEAPCYLCGNMCNHESEEPRASIYYEHIWPASYGGDSVEQNLIPACFSCNNAKQDMLLWQTGAVFSFVLKPNPSADERTRIGRREKIARRMQDILLHANQMRCTLKEAAIELGPAKFENLVAIDCNDAIDFFNLHFE